MPPSDTGWAWEPQRLDQLPAVRRELRSVLAGRPAAGPRERSEDLHDRMILLFDELLSNALRHGVAPVVAEVRPAGTAWLLVVSDGSAQVPPHPDLDRDPARGGLGLRLVADLARSYGWFSECGRKHVWALLDHLS